MRKLNLGCGPVVAEGWVNVDRVDHGQAYVVDFRERMPFDPFEFDAIVAHHSLPTLDYQELVFVLSELRRIAKQDAVIRVSVPSIAKAINAWQRGNWAWFPNSTGVGSNIDVTFCEYVTWYGHHRSVFTADALASWLHAAGWRIPRECVGGMTHYGWLNDGAVGDLIVELDDRAEESLYVEAIK